MTNDELKQHIYDFLKSRGKDGAMLDDLMEQPHIGTAGRELVQAAADALKSDGEIEGRDPIYGYRQL